MGKSVSLGELESALCLMAPMPQELRSVLVSEVCALGEPQKGGISFIAQSSFLDEWKPSSELSLVVVSEGLFERATAKVAGTTKILTSKNPMLALAKVSAFFKTEPVPTRAIHSSAEVHESAKLGKNVSIGPGCCIGKNVVLGDGCTLHANVTILNNAVLGANATLFPGVVIYHDVVIGDNVRIHANSVIGADGFGYVQEFSASGVKHVKIQHVGRVIIGNDVEIGASTTIDRGTVGDTVIGDGCIFDNHVQVGHNCKLGKGVIMCGTAGVAGSVTVGDYAVIGGYTAVANGLTVGARAKIAGYTMVFGDVPEGATWGGVPGRSLKEFWRLQALVGRLPELFEAYKLGRKKES